MAPKAEGRTLVLPDSVVGPVDLGRLMRELDTLDNALMQLRLRPTETPKLPKTSRLLDQTIELNKLNLLEEADFTELKHFLAQVKAHAPVLHISFGADPNPAFTQKMILWLRREINANVLMTVGLQPSIGAGCVVRSTNKYFDFSLREHFSDHRQLLVQQLHEVNQ